MSDEQKPHDPQRSEDPKDSAAETAEGTSAAEAPPADSDVERPWGEPWTRPDENKSDDEPFAVWTDPVSSDGEAASETQPEGEAASEAASTDAVAAENAPAEKAPVEIAPVAAVAAGGLGLAGAAAAVTSSEPRPIWSDDGDAPFEETPETARERKAAPRDNGARKARSAPKGGKPASAGSETWEIIKTVFFALLIALVLRVLFFQPFTIPSASMEPNLSEGDYIVVSKWTYGYSRHSIPFSPPLFQGRILGRAPERGEVVVFKLPRDNRTDYIKRVIGVPGDRVQMLNGVLHLNGAAVPDVLVERAEIQDLFGPRAVTRSRETLPGGRSFIVQDYGPGGDLDNTPLYEVPAGHYFMMGDNRDNSIDSRVEASAGVGLVPEENLVGKAEIILFSWSPGASLLNPVSWFAKVRPSRFFTVLD